MPARNAPSVSDSSARAGRSAGRQHDEQRHDGERFAVVGRGQRLEQRAHDEAAGEQGEHQRAARPCRARSALPCRACPGSPPSECRERQEEDRHDVLAPRGRRWPSGPSGSRAGCGLRGCGRRRPWRRAPARRRPGPPPARRSRAGQPIPANAPPHRMICSGARPIMSSPPRPYLAKREKCRPMSNSRNTTPRSARKCGRLVVLHEAEARGPDDDAGDEVADDGAEAHGARGERRRARPAPR